MAASVTDHPASGLGAVIFQLPDEWAQIRAAIADLDSTPALEAVLKTVEKRATLAMLEPDYIDRDFQDEHAGHYARTFRQLPNRCRRLHFFAEAGDVYPYLGYAVLRPLRAHPVGRTIIAPPSELQPHVSCVCTSVVRPHGERLRVSGFPFMEQDSQHGVCAHACVWMVALYHHFVNGAPRREVSDIATGAASHPEPLRINPSGGLSAAQVAVALEQLGLRPINYTIAGLSQVHAVSRTVCRYLNSRLPVVLATEGHATVLVGYGRDSQGRLFYVRSDEGAGPYDVVYASEDPLGPWNYLFVPTPGRIHLTGENAEPIARRYFQGLLKKDERAGLRKHLGARLRLRTYVTQAGDYKTRAPERGLSERLHRSFRFLPTPDWVWVIELQDPNLATHSRSCVLGEIAIDATCDDTDPNPLFGYIGGYGLRWEDGRTLPLQTELGDSTPHYSGTALHDVPSTELPGPKDRPRRGGGRLESVRRRFGNR
ncbi:MAG: hypothetical protein JWM60_1460 [Solirubrobacterales bacterium]|nr:hypothetical protein [Solirubrobacterales bacterium]